MLTIYDLLAFLKFWISECKIWGSHCKACHSDARWRAERERTKRAPTQTASASSVASARSTAISRSSSSSGSLSSSTLSRFSSSSTLSTGSNAASRSAEFSVRNLLGQVTAVHPVEMQPPAGRGFVTPLRHYQKQSLAFMVETERNHRRGGFLADEVGMGKSAVVLALVAANRGNPEDFATKQQIKDVMRTFDANKQKRREIEQDLQKLEKRLDAGTISDYQYDDCSSKMLRELEELEKAPIRKCKLKPTVILTSVSLIGQWEDEAKKHAPGLVVKTFHNSRSKNKANVKLDKRIVIGGLNEVDVIISTSTFKWPDIVTDYFEFKRVVHDESHLLIRGGASAKLRCASAIKSPLRWGVTATPATNSPMDLESQLSFIQSEDSNKDSFDALRSAISNFRYKQSESSFNSLVELLRPFMIRHTKSQRINGSEALALPPSTTSTIMLKMSKYENKAFNHINSSPTTFEDHCAQGVSSFTAEKAFCYQMPKVLRERSSPELLKEIKMNGKSVRSGYCYNPDRLTKVVALRKDLSELCKTEPSLRAVVFTQYLDMHTAVVRGLEADGFQVLQFTVSTMLY